MCDKFPLFCPACLEKIVEAHTSWMFPVWSTRLSQSLLSCERLRQKLLCWAHYFHFQFLSFKKKNSLSSKNWATCFWPVSQKLQANTSFSSCFRLRCYNGVHVQSKWTNTSFLCSSIHCHIVDSVSIIHQNCHSCDVHISKQRPALAKRALFVSFWSRKDNTTLCVCGAAFNQRSGSVVWMLLMWVIAR